MAETQSASEKESLEAGEPQLNPFLVVLLAWVLPGAGHFLLGRRGRALIFLLLVAFSAAMGVMLHGKLFQVVADQPLSRLGTLASMAMGAGYFVLRWGAAYQGDILSSTYEYGGAFLLTAGLMNLLVILDAWDIVTGQKS